MSDTTERPGYEPELTQPPTPAPAATLQRPCNGCG